MQNSQISAILTIYPRLPDLSLVEQCLETAGEGMAQNTCANDENLQVPMALT